VTIDGSCEEDVKDRWSISEEDALARGGREKSAVANDAFSLNRM
jgi:hypothetical protein